MKKIAIYNQKGGVGKTTSHINLSSAIGQLGKKTLMIDIDPQGNATSGMGAEKEKLETSIYDILIGQKRVQDVLLRDIQKNVDLLPSNIHLSGAEIELLSLPDKEKRLKEALVPVSQKYDYAFIDCPPSLGLLTLNALTAADAILIPIQCEYFALEGVGQLLNTFQLVKKSLNPQLELLGVFLSMNDSRTNLAQQVAEEVQKYFGDKVFRTAIPRNVKLAEAPSFGQPIHIYDPHSKGAHAYMALAKEILKRKA